MAMVAENMQDPKERTPAVYFRCSRAQLNVIREAAAARGLSMADWLREVVLLAAQTEGNE